MDNGDGDAVGSALEVIIRDREERTALGYYSNSMNKMPKMPLVGHAA